MCMCEGESIASVSVRVCVSVHLSDRFHLLLCGKRNGHKTNFIFTIHTLQSCMRFVFGHYFPRIDSFVGEKMNGAGERKGEGEME